MASAEANLVTNAIHEVSLPLEGLTRDYDPLIKLVHEARFCLLGEATHGTHEFYRERAEITKRLIKEKGFIAVAVEADWPDAFRVNRYVRGLGDDHNANEALGGFKRFPTWMWRNRVILDFVEWLRDYNSSLPLKAPKVGLYGLVVAESEAIALNFGKTPEDHVKHTVIEPTHMWLAQTPEGANAALEIDSADETKTVLRFRSALLPEFVDGVVLE